MKGAVRIVDGTVAPGMEVVHGPGLFAERPCANPACDRTIPASAARNKHYCEGRCKTAAWKARKAHDNAVLALTAFGHHQARGDAENARSEPLSKRAAELREARARGTVPSDLRVQYSRAVDVLEEYLRLLNVGSPGRVAHELMARALPKGRRA